MGMAVDLDGARVVKPALPHAGRKTISALPGPEQSARGRATRGFRVERYRRRISPMSREVSAPCVQQCDAAWCEPVCPTYAKPPHQTNRTQRTGLQPNASGPRYCANACPYSVRFFNFGNPVWDRPLELPLNPTYRCANWLSRSARFVCSASMQARNRRRRKTGTPRRGNQTGLRTVVSGRSRWSLAI